ncbi:MAG: hypothetical protein ACXWHG_13165 [Thermoanaerobaculia bacterium]
MSRGFVSALIGIAMTLLAWFGPWAWPAWPAFTAIDLVFGRTGFADYPFGVRSAVVLFLIVLNVSFWGAIAYGTVTALKRATRPRASGSRADQR